MSDMIRERAIERWRLNSKEKKRGRRKREILRERERKCYREKKGKENFASNKGGFIVFKLAVTNLEVLRYHYPFILCSTHG